jgi:NADH-quinone oxidoreductase subunit G
MGSDPLSREPAGFPHGDPVGAAGEAVTEPDPGAPAPVSGPGGEPGALAGGPPGEQSAEGERPAVGADPSGEDSGYAGGESAPETGATDDAGAEPAAAGGERGVGVDDQAGSVSSSASRGGETGDQRASASASAGAGGRSASGPGGDGQLAQLARNAGADAAQVRELAGILRQAGPVVIVWGERLSHGPRGKQAVDALLAVASALGVAETEGAGLLEVPAGVNGRGLREVGVLPGTGPGLAALDTPGRDAAAIAEALAAGDTAAVVLLHADPLATHPRRARWEAGLERATFVVAFAEFMEGAIAEYADVVLPAESYAEREGTVVHPDGRVQRLRQTIGHPGAVRPVWWALEQILERLGSGTGARSAPLVSEQIFKAVPFYEGLTLDEIGGRGVRWPEREAAGKLDAPDVPDAQLEDPPQAAEANGRLRLGTRPSLWTGYVTRHAPVLQFLKPEQTIELSPADAERLGVGEGTPVRVGVNGTRLNATVDVRGAMPEGTAYLIDGTEDEPTGLLLDGRPLTVEVSKD